MINSVFGKTMENLKKRIYIRLVNNAKDYKKYVSIFTKDLVVIHEIKLVFNILINQSM